MRKVRENIVATTGDQAIFAAGLAVYNDDGSLNVAPGQLVVYNPKDNISLGAGILAQDNPKVVIGVGIDESGNGVSDNIRSTYGDIFQPTAVQNVDADSPVCGIPEIHDFFFQAAECDQDYTIRIKVEDDRTQNEFPMNQFGTYTFTASHEECACETCDTGVDCSEVLCRLMETINYDNTNNPALMSRFNRLPAKKKDYPFYAVRLFGGATPLVNTTKVYCLDVVSGACETCNQVSAITEMTVDAVVIPIVNTLNPSDITTTLIGQLGLVVSQINTALGTDGSAVLVKGQGECCSIRLEINSCKDFAITGLTPCEEYNPFVDQIEEDDCVECGTGTTTTSYTCGLRIISKTTEMACKDCNANISNPIGYEGRNIQIYPVGGFNCSKTYTNKVQSMVLPQNLGYQWALRDYYSDNGGKGRGHNPFNDSFGNNFMVASGRIGGVETNCKTSYCSYVIEHSLPWKDQGVHGNLTASKGRTVFLIPSTDATTRTEFETLFNGYMAALPGYTAVTCA